MNKIINTNNYAIIGNPLNHSKSPYIYQKFAHATKENIRYNTILASIDNFDTVVSDFFNKNGHGLNITIPFKKKALEFTDYLTLRAAKAGAINVLWKTIDGKIFGDNTDGSGLIRDLTLNLKVDLLDLDILLIGAGGAARGVVLPLIECRPSSLTIINRNSPKAHLLLKYFSEYSSKYSTKLISGGLELGIKLRYDVVINATSSSINKVCPCLFYIKSGGIAYDMMYSANPSPFMLAASLQKAKVYDGLGMLVEQATETFEIWRGIRPNSKTVINELRSFLMKNQC